MKPLFFLPLTAPLIFAMGGCNLGLMDKNYISRAETIPVTAAPATVSTVAVQAIAPEDSAVTEARNIAALHLPEGSGKILKVREKHFANGTRQEIIIAADKGTYGENVIDVHIRTAEPGSKHTNPMRIGPPTENGTRNEILSRFPDVQMNIVTRPIRNTFGPFGLAIGRHAGGARCVFAWQWIEDLRESAPGTSNLTKMNAMIAGKNLAASIRIRLCSTGATVDQLASQLEGLRVSSRAALERITKLDRRDIEGEPIAMSANRSAPLVRSVGGSLEAALIRPVKREGAPVKVARAKPKNAPRQYVRRDPPQQQVAPQPAPAYVPAPLQSQPITPQGQRYLAPVAGMPAPPAYGAAAPGVPSPGGGIALPPQAYRGPGQ